MLSSRLHNLFDRRCQSGLAASFRTNRAKKAAEHEIGRLPIAIRADLGFHGALPGSDTVIDSWSYVATLSTHQKH